MKLSMYQLRKLIWNMYDITKEWTSEGLVIPRSWKMLVEPLAGIPAASTKLPMYMRSNT